MYALAGASDAHNQIVVNLVALIRPQVRGTTCRVFANDMRLRISSRLYYYPDLMIVCDPTDNMPTMRSRPCALIEVLSPSIESVDQREKVLVYKQIPELQAYVLIHQNQRLVEHHVRINGDIWRIEERSDDGIIGLPCADIVVPISDLYEDVQFPSPYQSS